RPEDAIETYRRAIDVDESDTRALDALGELYREREKYKDLSELLLRRAESAPSADASAGFRIALARLLKGQLGEPERAVDQLDEIVRTVPHHQEAIAELELLKDDDAHRERVV